MELLILCVAAMQSMTDALAHLKKCFHTATTVLQKVEVVLDAPLLEHKNSRAASKLEVTELVTLCELLLQLMCVHD